MMNKKINLLPWINGQAWISMDKHGQTRKKIREIPRIPRKSAAKKY
jgi:hypothetical protein